MNCLHWVPSPQCRHNSTANTRQWVKRGAWDGLLRLLFGASEPPVSRERNVTERGEQLLRTGRLRASQRKSLRKPKYTARLHSQNSRIRNNKRSWFGTRYKM